MILFSIRTGTLDKSLIDLETKKIRYNNMEKENEILYDFEKS